MNSFFLSARMIEQSFQIVFFFLMDDGEWYRNIEGKQALTI
jgi:hypothetical protein